MLGCGVRTTVNINDGLLQRAKELAVRTGRPLGEVVDDGLRLLLHTMDDSSRRGPVELPTYGGSGLQPGVDLDDKEALSDLLERDEVHRRAAV